MSHIIIGTAGHIDHGKTSLVKALTGMDTDRLKEEKERGLTIDIGFAFWGDRATIIDVPGHEKFIRNMVAGVSTIDYVLFIVAADDGIMPQTREHLDILKILQVEHGIVALTKIDLVEEEWLELVREDVRAFVQDSFLKNAPILPVSSITMEGVPELKKTLESEWSGVREKRDKGVFWMPVDRAFSMKGFGTVVTGSVLSGTAKTGHTLEILPQKKPVKIRGLQSHGQSVERVTTGDRAAVNLQAVAKENLQRGDVLTTPDYFQPSQRFDARLDLLQNASKTIKPGSRVRLHIGTSEIMARVSILSGCQIGPGDSGYVQFHLEKSASARRLDPFVVRQYSPTVTIGGGIILDANARKHRLRDAAVSEHLKTLEKENPKEVLESTLLSADFGLYTLDQLAAALSASREALQGYVSELAETKRVVLLKKDGAMAVIHAKKYQDMKDHVISTLQSFHNDRPTKTGLLKTELLKTVKTKVAPFLINSVLENLKSGNLVAETSGCVHLQGHQPTLSGEQERLREQIDRLLYEQAFATSSAQEIAQNESADPDTVDEILGLMINQKQVVRLEGNVLLHSKRMEEAKQKVVSYLQTHEQIAVGQFKDLLGGTSRKYALPILIHFDGLGITERDGDVRILGSR
ncbi:selenocysteine-specific translation elongation factor [bacterium]|nr:selenocysteine-specific translation elongation factor [bacterium]